MDFTIKFCLAHKSEVLHGAYTGVRFLISYRCKLKPECGAVVRKLIPAYKRLGIGSFRPYLLYNGLDIN